MSKKSDDIQTENNLEDQQGAVGQPGCSKDDVTTENLEKTTSTASTKVKVLRSRKKSAKTRLTKARKQLTDLVDGNKGTASKTEIRKAVYKVESEFEIIMKLIYNLKETITLEDGDESVDIDATIEALDTEVDELTAVVDTVVKAAKEHVQERLEKGEAKSVSTSLESKDDDDDISVKSKPSIASTRRREADESKQRFLQLQLEQQQEEEDLQRRVAALQLTKQRTEEARRVVAINEARATAAEDDVKTISDASSENYQPLQNHEHKKQLLHEEPMLSVKDCTPKAGHFKPLAPTRLKGVELPTFSGENKADYAPWKAAFMSVVDEAAISTNEKMLRLQNSLSGKALRMVKDLGFTTNAYARAKAKLEKKYGGEMRLQLTNLTTLRGWPKLRAHNLDDMEEFLALLDRVLVSLQDCGLDAAMSGQNLNLTAKEKLSANDVQAYKYWLREHNEKDTLETLVRWLEIRVEIMDETKEERQEDKHDEKRRNRGFSGNISRKPKGCVVPTCKEDHPPWVCSSFKRLPVPERKDLISKTKRCFRCLALGHQSKDCPNVRQCGIDHCTSDRHSRYLHDANVRHQDDAANRKSTTKEENGSVLPNPPAAGEVKETTHTANRVDNVSLMVIPAYITNGKKKLRVNVMLDPCSTGTYVTESASQELNLRGKVQSLTISGTGGTKVKTESRRVELSVTSIDEMFSTKIQANVLENITGETPAISWSDVGFVHHSKGYLFQKGKI